MDEPRGRLLFEFIRVVRESLPIGFVMENVKGMANWNHGAALRAIEDTFADPIIFKGKKYQYVVQHKVLNAANFGVPQFRERIFLIGNRLDKEFEFPAPTHGMTDGRIGLFQNYNLKKFATVWDVIGDLPPAEEPSEIAKRVSKTIKERIKKHGY